jgi:hypothetical protein
MPGGYLGKRRRAEVAMDAVCLEAMLGIEH